MRKRIKGKGELVASSDQAKIKQIIANTGTDAKELVNVKISLGLEKLDGLFKDGFKKDEILILAPPLASMKSAPSLRPKRQNVIMSFEGKRNEKEK